jgi:hypothetical protein
MRAAALKAFHRHQPEIMHGAPRRGGNRPHPTRFYVSLRGPLPVGPKTYPAKLNAASIACCRLSNWNGFRNTRRS